MKRILLFLILAANATFQYGQIIADHTVVDKYDQIPQQYIDAVKTMLVWIPGMSHGYGYIRGVELLESYDQRFQVLTFTTEPVPGYSADYLRLGRPYMTGEEGFYTSQSGIDGFKSQITTQNISGNQYDVIGFGWSYGSTWVNAPGGTLDPVYNVHWAGSSEGGVDGNKRWGLDQGDSILTGNRVCMDTYLEAIEQYIQFCTSNGYDTKMIFTNGCVDDNAGTESGFQRELKNKHIRDYVPGNSTQILFDYADILVHNNSGELHMAEWNDGGNIRPHQQIHPDNLMDYDESFNVISPGSDAVEDHIGDVGTLRLAKAMWWMLARIAGWDGNGASTGFEKPEEGNHTEVVIKADSQNIWINTSERFLNGSIGLYQINGSLIEHIDIDSNVSKFNASILSPGMYVVVLTKDNFREVEKIIMYQ